MEGSARADLGVIRARRGQFAAAIGQFEEALRLFRAVGQRPLEADTLLSMGDALARHGQEDAAGRAWQQAYLMYAAFRQPQAEDARERLVRHGQPVPDPGGNVS